MVLSNKKSEGNWIKGIKTFFMKTSTLSFPVSNLNELTSNKEGEGAGNKILLELISEK